MTDIAFGTTEAAAQWRLHAAARNAAMAPSTERMFARAAIHEGAHVLDVGAGTGDTALEAAARVGPRGHIVATDVSSPMLAQCAAAARQAGIHNVETLVADAAALKFEATFDAVIGRNVLMFVDLPRALSAIRSALRPGGRFATTVWGPLERNPYHAIPIEVVRRMNAMPSPEPHIVRAFSLSNAGSLRAAFERAGFADVAIESVSVTRHFATIDEAVAANRPSGPIAELTARLDQNGVTAFHAAVADAFAPFLREQGFVITGEQLVVAGKNAARHATG